MLRAEAEEKARPSMTVPPPRLGGVLVLGLLGMALGGCVCVDGLD